LGSQKQHHVQNIVDIKRFLNVKQIYIYFILIIKTFSLSLQHQSTEYFKLMKQKLLLLLFCLFSLTVLGADKEDVTSENTEVMSAPARRPMYSEEFYQEMLEAFCMKHFNEKFAFFKVFNVGAVKYWETSLRAESAAYRDTNTDLVRGKLSFSYLWGLMKCKDGEFTAIVKKGTEPNEFIVLFLRCGGFIPKNVRSTDEVSFIYPE